MGTGKNEGKGTSYQRIYLHDHDEQNFAVRQDSEKKRVCNHQSDAIPNMAPQSSDHFYVTVTKDTWLADPHQLRTGRMQRRG
jgi:hypothetical protein